MRERMLSRAFLASLLAAAAGWESGKTCTTDDVRTLAKKDAKLSGTALAECVILDLRGETIAPEMLPRQVVVRTGHGIEDKEDTMIEPTTRMPLLTPAQLGELLGANSTISRVQLGWNFGMKEEGAETVDLSGNKIGDAGALEVARWLQNHPQTKLASLELRGADITAAGAQAIADVVWPRPPPHLIDLDLRGNIISRGVSVGDHMGELPPPIQWDGPDGQYYQ